MALIDDFDDRKSNFATYDSQKSNIIKFKQHAAIIYQAQSPHTNKPKPPSNRLPLQKYFDVARRLHTRAADYVRDRNYTMAWVPLCGAAMNAVPTCLWWYWHSKKITDYHALLFSFKCLSVLVVDCSYVFLKRFAWYVLGHVRVSEWVSEWVWVTAWMNTWALVSQWASKCLCLPVHVSAIMYAHDHRVRTQFFRSFLCENIVLVYTHASPVHNVKM